MDEGELDEDKDGAESYIVIAFGRSGTVMRKISEQFIFTCHFNVLCFFF